MTSVELLVNEIGRYKDVRDDQCMIIKFGKNTNMSDYDCKFVRYIGVNIIILFPKYSYVYLPNHICFKNSAYKGLDDVLHSFDSYTTGVFTCPTQTIFMCRYLKLIMYIYFILGYESTVSALENMIHDTLFRTVIWDKPQKVDYKNEYPYSKCYDGEGSI